MSFIFDGFLTTPEAQDAFADRQFVSAMLRFEAALASAQAAEGLIPESSAASIIRTCKVELFDVPKLVRESGPAGSIAVPLVKSLKEAVALFNPAAQEHTHVGCIAQDVVDTAMVLVTRQALMLIEADLARVVQVLSTLARQYASTPMLARTLMQPASVTSFGLKCVGWLAPLVRSQRRLVKASQQAMKLQLGGAVGTLAEMGEHGPAVARRMAQDLGLQTPESSWQSQRDEWVALGCELGLLTGSLGKLARDIALMSQFEVAEVAEPDHLERGRSSTLLHKRNPVGSMVAIAAAQRVPQRVAALLQSMAGEHERSLGHWQVELAEWPQLVLATHGSVRAMAHACEGLRVDPDRMNANLAAVHGSMPSEIQSQWFSAHLVRHAAEQVGRLLRGLETPAKEPPAKA
jgi:3-carboxy-cis,cis-muconate cycloisomerase